MADEGAVMVCVRVRPLIERENSELGGKETIAWKSEKCNISQVDGTKFFTFDRVFHSEESTAEVYKEVADPIIKSAVQGYNGTIFAYGQTASGKTHTMLGTKSSPGILPMAIEDVFKTICRIPDREFLLRISYMEIHNETIQDLLCSSIRKKKPLVVREDINRNIYVEDLTEEVVVSPEQVMDWLQKGEKSRHYGETKMNVRSSRSHTIFRMIIESKEKSDASNSNCDGAVMVSHLNLVDLAGSERASQTGTDGVRLKEGCNINRSLFILGQVIKKLCDDQSGGFINYRDSKLTRILQNSLGGNAKTAIICTVTPVSLEETLSTLQFASTAKKMKNSPKVNEVLDDDALLKRYRKEIEDLKRRLEEVSSDSHTRNEEKDLLAQLLEEQNSLQKQQEDRIRTLAEMVVTSSSFLREQELKARKKRRVTWTPGQISHSRSIFSEVLPGRTKRFKSSLSALSVMEESVSSEFSECDDHCLAITATMPEEEWIPGPEMSLIHKDFADSVDLCETLAAERDSAITKQQATQAELVTVQLEKEQLSQEVRELTEKIETNEFIVLEREALQQHEMQLMHEISNLKAVIVRNQDLQDNLKSNELRLEEKENRINALEKQIIELNSLLEESRKTGGGNIDASLVGTSQAMDEMKQSLNDAEIVAIDAKKESAFLRSENLQLKERIDQLLDDCNRMGKDVECYRSQLEAGKVTYKKMQSDLQKELQYYFQQNTKLTSLLEGNQSSVELDEQIAHLKNELSKALAENVSLRKEVAVLSETGLKPDLEILHKEILEKSEMIASLTSEREALLSQVAEKGQRLLEMTDALKSKEDFADAEAVRRDNEAVRDLECQRHELEQELATVSEENKRLQGQIENQSGENLKLNAAISEMAQELSSKVQELQAKDLEQEKLLRMEEELSCVRQELNSVEQLKDQLKAWESKAEAGEVERLAVVQRLQGREEEISALAQERDELKQMLEAVERERDQIKDDIEETVAINIETQNEVRSSQAFLKQCQENIKELQATILKKDSQIASIKETLEATINEQKLQLSIKIQELQDKEKGQKEFLQTMNEQRYGEAPQDKTDRLKALEFELEAKKMEELEMAERLQQGEEERKLLTLERDDLQQKWETVHAEKEKLKELLEGTTSELSSKIQELQVEARELLQTKEQLYGEAQLNRREVEQLTEQLRTLEAQLEAKEGEKLEMAKTLRDGEEERRSLVLERDDLKQKWDALQTEKEITVKPTSNTQGLQARNTEEEELPIVKEEFGQTRQKQSELEELREQLKASECRMEVDKMAAAQELREHEETLRALVQERDHWRHQRDALQLERDQVQEETRATQSMLSSKIQELQVEAGELLQTKEQLCGEAQRNRKEVERLTEQLRTLEAQLEAKEREKQEMAERLQDGDEERRSLVLERDDLKKKWDSLQTEKEKLKELLEETTAKLTSNVQALQAGNTQEEELVTVKEKLGQALQELSELEELREQLKASKCRTEADKMVAARELREREEALVQERDNLRHQRDDLQLERDQVQEEMRTTESMLSNKIQELQVEARELLETKEQLCGEAQQNRREVERLTEQLRTLEAQLEAKEGEKLQMAERLQDGDKERRSLVLERDDLKQKRDALQTEKEKLKELLEETTAKLSSKIQELQVEARELLETKEQLCFEAQQNWREAERLTEQLRTLEAQLEAKEGEKLQMDERLQDGDEERRSLVLERDDLKQKRDALQTEKEKLKEEVERLTEQLRTLEAQLESKEGEKLQMAERLQDGDKERRSLVLERDDLKQKRDALQTEKEKLKELLEETTAKGLELQEQLRNSEGSLKEYHDTVEELRGENSQALKMQKEFSQTIEQLKQKVVDTQAEVEKLLEKAKSQEQQLWKREAELAEEMAQLKEKLEQLTEKLSLQMAENNRLLAERKAEAESMQHLGMQNSALKKDRDDIQQAMEDSKAENEQLRGRLLENTAKFSETNAKLQQDLHELRQQLDKAAEEKTPEKKEQDDLEMLQAKVSKMKEALQKLPAIEERYEHLGRAACNLKVDSNHQKELATKGLKDASHETTKQIRRLQMEHEVLSDRLHRLLYKTQFLLTRLCKKKSEHYVNISNYTMELLGERRKQRELLTQIQSLKEPCQKSPAAVSQQLRIPELSKDLDFHVEQIWKDVSQMDEEIRSIEVMLQQLENEGRTEEESSVPFDVQDFERGIKQDKERLLLVGRFLKPKAQSLMEAREELESRNANYCEETEAALKICRERTRELLLALNMLKEQPAPSGHADLILEKENCRLESKLKTRDQDMKDLKLELQKLENAANEARKNLQEKETRIAVLEMELKVRASKSEVVRLRAALEEKECFLTSTLTENQTLKAQLNKGSELYKEEIEDLKTQLAKADMTLTKQSKCFDREMANAKALAEHREEQLRRVREELRRVQLEQDVTVMSSQEAPQPLLPITCGGGSGIVQNTQMLVLNAERTKLEREVTRLKKEHELVLKNELHLKEEVKKWKERALKMREQSRGTSEEQRLKSPRKTAPPMLTQPPSSPSKERSLLPPLALDAPPGLLPCPPTFFDNSRLGPFNDVRLADGESIETASSGDRFKHWMEKSKKEGNPECKTQ
uniref:centromere-associated protein E n=1 Tax=Euleptes europaea TaxID=460621 RepID=UPI0025415534|nr:centromere-associated protein E [Euleptes europaea]